MAVPLTPCDASLLRQGSEPELRGKLPLKQAEHHFHSGSSAVALPAEPELERYLHRPLAPI